MSAEIAVVIQVRGGEPSVRVSEPGEPEAVMPVKFVPPFPPPVELRKLPRALQEAILAASAELAEEEYRTNADLTDFDAMDLED